MYKWLVVLGLFSVNCYGQVYGWDSSPLNPVNSPYALSNSPYNLANSPYNINNSPYNFNSPNNIINNDGDQVGYIVNNPSGITNYFNQEGERIGYGRHRQR